MKITCTFDTDTHKVVPIEPTSDMVFATTHINNVLDNCDLFPMLRAAIAAAPPYPADDGWIPCSERLPDREGYFDVFVRSPGESIYNGRQADVLYCDSRWQATLQYGQHVSHWRPLPLPAAPKGE